jgi:hypothetical protein
MKLSYFETAVILGYFHILIIDFKGLIPHCLNRRSEVNNIKPTFPRETLKNTLTASFCFFNPLPSHWPTAIENEDVFLGKQLSCSRKSKPTIVRKSGKFHTVKALPMGAVTARCDFALG